MSTLTQWEAFHAGMDTVDVDHDVLTSWRRSKWSGIDPHDVPIPGLPFPRTRGFTALRYRCFYAWPSR